MTSLQDLHDPTKTCIALAAREDVEDTTRYPDCTPFSSRDIPEGYALRLQAYQEAWMKCLSRVQAIVHELNTPVVNKVVCHIRGAYAESYMLPGLPYHELPAIGISASGGNSTIFSDVIETLQDFDEPGDSPATRLNGHSEPASEDPMPNGTYHNYSQNMRPLVAHMHPSECPNLLNTMKSLVSGFVDQPEEDEEEDGLGALTRSKRKATTSLANYDIRLLVAWYTSSFQLRGTGPQLIVVLHDFEQFNVSVLQDMFYICSQQIPRLPLVFLLQISSPSNPSYIHTAFSRSTLALLRLQVVTAPPGIEVVRRVIHRTFFDIDFEPDIMLGPAALDFLLDYTTRHIASLDALLNIIQLAYLKHFEEPLTVFIHNVHLGAHSLDDAIYRLEQPESFDFLDTLLTRIWHDYGNLPEGAMESAIDWMKPSVSDLLDIVSSAHQEAKRRAVHMKLGFQIMTLVQDFLRSNGYKTTSSGREEDQLEQLRDVIRGRVNQHTKYLGIAVKKLNGRQLESLLSKLREFFQSLNSHLRPGEEESRVRIVTASLQLPKEAIEEEGLQEEFRQVHPAVPPIAADVGKWLTEYLESKIVRLDQGLLWDIWNTGMTQFPSELLNPAPRQTIINALLHPHDVIESHRALIQDGIPPDEVLSDDEAQLQRALWELPDISILFRRYMEAGKLINVYDWYESFSLAVETQRRHLRKIERRSKRNTTASPTKSKKGMNRGRSKTPAVNVEDLDEEFESKEEEEEWKVQVQARFIRALHELDFMGFLKHTNRKTDHVIKTTYDIPD